MISGDLATLKRRWLPLFVLGAAVFGAGVALLLLWLYRNSPLVDVVVGLVATEAGVAPPRGTLVSLAAALLTIGGGLTLLVAVRRIHASEIGEIDSFWWKVAVATLAGRWWLGEPRVVVIPSEAGESSLPVLRGLKTFTGHITVLAPPASSREALVEMIVALAEDETGIRSMVEALTALGDGFDAQALSTALRLRGRVELAGPAPRLAYAVANADAIIFGSTRLPDSYPDEVKGWLRRARGKKIGVMPIAAPGDSAIDLRPIAEQIGALDVALLNSNTVPPLATGHRYLAPPNVDDGVRALIARDVVDWSEPARHDPVKLAVYLREVILRG